MKCKCRAKSVLDGCGTLPVKLSKLSIIYKLEAKVS